MNRSRGVEKVSLPCNLYAAEVGALRADGACPPIHAINHGNGALVGRVAGQADKYLAGILTKTACGAFWG